MTEGVIRPSASPWVSPVTLAPKRDGSIRFCVHLRRVNDVTMKDRYPLPLIQDIFYQLGGSLVYSTLDRGMMCLYCLLQAPPSSSKLAASIMAKYKVGRTLGSVTCQHSGAQGGQTPSVTDSSTAGTSQPVKGKGTGKRV